MTIADDEHDPCVHFDRWFARAREEEPSDADAMALATTDGAGALAVRMVLLKARDERGFVFFTNADSDKGRHLVCHPVAALCFFWRISRRQVRVEGSVEGVDASVADAFFVARPRESRIGAWASRQSRPLADAYQLEADVARMNKCFPGETVPRPPFWSGFRVVPARIEFWSERPNRLHDRLVFERAADGWTSHRLYP